MNYHFKLITLLLISILNSNLANAGCLTQNTSITLTKPDSIYTDNNDGTITDLNTGLMWQKCSLGLSGVDCTTGIFTALTWVEALAAATQNTTAGYSDWRLPNKNELNSLIERACYRPAINVTFFPMPAASNINFWSSTPVFRDPDRAWEIKFESGSVSTDGGVKGMASFVRLVRGVDNLTSVPSSQLILN